MNSKFHTPVSIPDYGWKTGYQKKNLFLGSCFTEHIGAKMASLKYPVDINPFGILYNPASVAQALNLLIQQKQFSPENLIRHEGLWHSFYHHSRFSSTDAGETLSRINERLQTSARFLFHADFLFITFGTAWVYQYKDTAQIVSNCHKIPEKAFTRYRLTPEEITEQYRQLLPEIRKKNPGLKIIFTVSPIRHWKDGAVENQRSKATLILAIDRLISESGDEHLAYFPSYEIVMDELRDYRYYEEDMIHLSSFAINHIWDTFRDSFMDETSRQISREVQKVLNALNHKPFNIYTQQYLHFLEQSLRKTRTLQENFSYLNMRFEEKEFSDRISAVRKKMNL